MEGEEEGEVIRHQALNYLIFVRRVGVEVDLIHQGNVRVVCQAHFLQPLRELQLQVTIFHRHDYLWSRFVKPSAKKEGVGGLGLPQVYVEY